jgi:Zn-dependent protease
MLLDFITGQYPNFQAFLIELLLSVPPFLLALSVHEAAHAWVANRCGDPTARYLGRLTINPLAHVDPVGFIMLFAVGFGWAKPVPVNPNNFRNYRRDDIKVSLAGITVNFLMFLISYFVMYLIAALTVYRNSAGLDGVWLYLYQMIVLFARVNLVLAVFNLLPIPPLDGYHVLNDVILRRSLFASQRAMMIGQFVLIALVFSGVFGRVLSVVTNGVMTGVGTVYEALFRALHII